MRDLLGGLMTGSLQANATPAPDADFWYHPVGVMTAAGLKVDAAGARKIGAWYRGRDILATSVAMIPLHGYRKLPDDEGRAVAGNHPLYDVLHRKPNASTDKFQYVRQAMFDVIDDGWHYARIVEGPRGFADQLERIAPTLVTPKLVTGPLGARWIFTVRDEQTGQSTTRTQDEIFYLRGVDGKGILDYARDSLGLSLTLESYASKLFSRGAMNSGLIETPGPMPDETAMQRMALQFKTAMSDWHMPRVLPHGAKFTPSMMDPEKAQMILSRKFSVIDIARWLGLPSHMLNETDSAGVTGLEQKGQEFVTFSLGGWLSMWEFAINDQLVLAPQTFFFEFQRDALARGDLAVRWAAYVSSVNAGIVTPDEVRVKENYPKKGGKASELRDPQNITGRGAYGGPQDNQRPGRDGAPDDKAQAIATASAARLLRKEITAIQKFAVKHANDQDGFAAAVTHFYAGHVALVIDTLQMSDVDAAGYCAGQSARALAGWMAALDEWKTDNYAQGLAAWALGDAA